MLNVKFLDVHFINPLIVPSGIIPEIPDSLKAETYGAAGVVTKSVTVLPREGNPMPRVVKYEHGVLNSVGLRNPGIDKSISLLGEILSRAKIPVLISVFAISVKDFKLLVEKVSQLNPKFIELNLSCPNTTNELGEPLGMNVDATKAAVAGAREVADPKIKLIAKLSPNAPNIGEIAKAAEAAGADAISAINTVGPGMVIDIKTKKPQLGNKEGGVTGPGIRPVAVRCVYDIYKSVKIPIIGMGGVETWKDVIEMMLAGATLVGVGSAIYRHGYPIIGKIKQELETYMAENNINNLSNFIGLAHVV